MSFCSHLLLFKVLLLYRTDFRLAPINCRVGVQEAFLSVWDQAGLGTYPLNSHHNGQRLLGRAETSDSL